jgi:hypothetical protein
MTELPDAAEKGGRATTQMRKAEERDKTTLELDHSLPRFRYFLFPH